MVSSCSSSLAAAWIGYSSEGFLFDGFLFEGEDLRCCVVWLMQLYALARVVMLEGYPLCPVLGSDQCTLIPSPRPDLDGSLAFLVAAMVFQKLTSFSGKIESEVYRLAFSHPRCLKRTHALINLPLLT